ncbi:MULTISPECIES: GPP34 family phosphoprotein [unclassified Actinopolyspora]|uniref:GPP34 family phosphoprotein n=1 Tax=unclassified Actinopolyspora TaxID=2639451 RepID=UPI0013F5C68A|nr:GPP34 family phosphoprotein [Actinopolyspora sp. BKK2]NHE75854.1 GPP34 family phosphoprotein [Actinopolyspora sp. BKK1]
MSERSPGVSDLSLPAELVLLLHKTNGRPFASVDAHTVVAVAEVAELVLRGRVELRGRRPRSSRVVLLDRSPTGVDWLDRDLELLVFWMSSRSASISLRTWFSLRRLAFTEHRSRLHAAGHFEHRRDRVLGLWSHERYVPSERERGARLEKLLRVARGESHVDDRTLLFVALSYFSGLSLALSVEQSLRERLGSIARGEKLGEAVDTTVVTAQVAVVAGGAVATGGDGDGGDGGDGGGG